MISASRAGAALVGAAGILWGTYSASSGDWIEAAQCGSVGVGFTLVAWSQRSAVRLRAASGGAARRNALAIGALTLAAVGSAPWFFHAVSAGNWPLRWGAVSLGIAVAAGSSFATRPWVAMGQRFGFALVAFGMIMLLASDVSVDVWPASYVVALAGALLLAFRPVDGADAEPEQEMKEESETTNDIGA